MNYGIDDINSLIDEGSATNYGHVLWPEPIVMPRQTFGALPTLLQDEIPESVRAMVETWLHRLADAIHSEGSDSVVDRAREAAAMSCAPTA